MKILEFLNEQYKDAKKALFRSADSVLWELLYQDEWVADMYDSKKGV
jgi:hypothetical protein